MTRPAHRRRPFRLRTILLGLCLGLLLAPPARAGEQPRILFVALDAVPYGEVVRLTDPSRGQDQLFQGLSGPVPLVSTFPSTTSLALSGILEPFGLEKPPGYEARFFDRSKGKVRGGGPISYGKITFGWREFFDWSIKGMFHKAIAYIRPRKYNRLEVKRSIDAFLGSDQRFFFVYVTSTDPAGHLYGPEELERPLGILERNLIEARQEHPDEHFYSVLFSDHGFGGGERLQNLKKGVKDTLKGAGFRLREKIAGPADAVIIPYGLVSSFVLYTWEGREKEAAASLVQMEGVDLCTYRTRRGWAVAGGDGTAAIHRRSEGEQELWSYRPLSGDPLGYAPILPGLRHASGDGAQHWFLDQAWFYASRNHTYPDALYRLGQAFELVQNPASVICSLSPGYMFGRKLVQVGARLASGGLRWTHGALDRDDSLGFLMTDYPGWVPPPALRFDRALAAFTTIPSPPSRSLVTSR